MTTTTILRCGLLSRDLLLNDVYAFYNDGDTTDEEILDKADEIVSAVNRMLPGSLYWSDETSEIWANIEDNTRIDEEEFKDILTKAFYEVVS